MIFLYATTYQQASDYAARVHIPSNDWLFLHDAKQLQHYNRHSAVIWRVGSGRGRFDYGAIIDTVNARGIKMVHAPTN